MAASSLRHHMERTHRKVVTLTRGVDIEVRGVDTYGVSFPRILTAVTCPVEGCTARSHNHSWI